MLGGLVLASRSYIPSREKRTSGRKARLVRETRNGPVANPSASFHVGTRDDRISIYPFPRPPNKGDRARGSVACAVLK